MPNGDRAWRSYLKASHSTPPRWSQEYQAALVGADARAALDNEKIAGIALWQLSDMKTNDGAQRDCGPCVYATPWDPTVPMNCSYVNDSCWRPAGKNNKGSVDMWRRQKLAFSVVRDLFRQPF